jgi:hypothetical protein
MLMRLRSCKAHTNTLGKYKDLVHIRPGKGRHRITDG